VRSPTRSRAPDAGTRPAAIGPGPRAPGPGRSPSLPARERPDRSGGDALSGAAQADPPGTTADFRLRDGERLIRFAAGASAEAVELIEAQGLGGYALLSTARALEQGAPTGLVEAAAVVVQVPPGPVPDASAAVRGEVGGRSLVALGGGRVIDAGKAIAAADGLRVAAIPTTLAGSAFTPFHRLPAGVEGVSMLRPVLAVCDPQLMASAALPGLAATAMNALAHAVEALYAPGANPIAEGAALRSAALFARGLPADPPVRADIALAAVLAGWAVGTTGLAVHHALCQTIVRVAGTPHAATNAVMLPHSVAFMADRAPREIGRLAQALGAPGPDPAAASGPVAVLAAHAGPRTLRELGVERHGLDAVVASALAHPGLPATPGGVSSAELRALLARASA